MGTGQLQYFHNGLARRVRGFFDRRECASLQFSIYAVVVFLCSLGCRDFTFAAANESTAAVHTSGSSQFLHMDIRMQQRVHGSLLLRNSWGSVRAFPARGFPPSSAGFTGSRIVPNLQTSIPPIYFTRTGVYLACRQTGTYR